MRLSSAVGSVFGACEPAVQRMVSSRIDELLDELIVESVAQWRGDRFVRFDDKETNCAVQIFRCFVTARRGRSRLRVLQPTYEHYLLTEAILSGRESASSARRPDMHVAIGEFARRSVECKLLSDSGDLARRYVADGVCRFVVGSYGAGEPSGRMIGFVLAGTKAACAARINDQVITQLDASHSLRHRDTPDQCVDRLDSDHVRDGLPDISLVHYLVDLSST